MEHQIARYIVADTVVDEYQEVPEFQFSSNMQGDFMNFGNLGNSQIDPRCEDEESSGCCSRGKFYENDSVWEYAQKGLKTVCGCSNGQTICEEPSPEAMVQKRSKCSLRLVSPLSNKLNHL